ncbi:MAG TPA: FkbM family methyltransferase [Armatimonadota bacterium]|jgi:FkbM family methyltransferase
MARVGIVQRTASRALLGYLRRRPTARGSWRALTLAKPFLVAELEPGVYIRPYSLSPIELGILRKGVLEPETVDVFRGLLRPGLTVIDLGANIGQYTLLAAHHVGPHGQVHAFEPTPEVADSLQANVTLNGFGNVTICRAAVSDAPGIVHLHPDPEAPDINSILPVRGQNRGATVEVPALRLDDYIAQRGLGPVDMVKMDIEGAEMMALAGAPKLLSGETAPILILELNPEALDRAGSSPAELLRLLERHGYAYHGIASYGGDTYANGIATKPGHWRRFPGLHEWDLRPVTEGVR